MASYADRILRVVCDSRTPITPSRAAMLADIRSKAAAAAIVILVKRGLVYKTLEKHRRFLPTDAGRELHREGKPVPTDRQSRVPFRRHEGSLRDRLWKAMRLSKKFTINDLLGLALYESESAESAHANARDYLGALEKAGHLSRMAKRAPGTAPGSNGYVRWLLVNDTGPVPPVQRPKAHTLYDPNTGEEHRIGKEAS